MEGETSRKRTITASIVCYVFYVICLIMQQTFVANLISPLCCLFAMLTIISVARHAKHYRSIVVAYAAGIGFWILGDLTFLLNWYMPALYGSLGDFSDMLYRCTNYAYLVGLILFISKDFYSRDLFRFLAYAALYSIALHILIRAWFTIGTGIKLNFHTMPVINVFYSFTSFFIVILTLIAMVNRDTNQTTMFGVLLFLSFFIYGISDTRYQYMSAAGLDGESDFFNAIFVLSIVLLGLAFSKISISTFLKTNTEKFQVKEDDIVGFTIAIIGLVISGVMYLLGFLDESDLVILFVVGLSYFLISKTMLANDLNRKLIVKQEEEKDRLKDQLSFQQQELSSANEQLEQATYMDHLTGLSNLAYWEIYQNDVLLANPDIRFVLFSLDINYFKLMNDTYGISGADEILREYGRRLASLENDYIQAFRIGGDQFMISCADLDGAFDCDAFVQDLKNILDRPFELSDTSVHLNSSVGGAIYPDDTNDIEKLMLYADYAKRSVKHSSNLTSCAFYGEKIVPLIQRKLLLESKLQNVEYDRDFYILYQPQVEVKTGKLLGMEALLRWNDPELGVILPEEFIPIAEEMGIMAHMGEWILAETLHQISEWNHKYEKEYVMCINLSPIQLRDEHFAEDFLAMMEETDNKPEWIDLEIVEGAALNGDPKIKENVDKLRAANVYISVDDFGTGFGNFMNMLDFKFDRIKITEKLIGRLKDSEEARVITLVIVGMARGLHMITIAVGVEDEETLDILTDLGCDQIQGFYTGIPLSTEEFEQHWF